MTDLDLGLNDKVGPVVDAVDTPAVDLAATQFAISPPVVAIDAPVVELEAPSASVDLGLDAALDAPVVELESASADIPAADLEALVEQTEPEVAISTLNIELKAPSAILESEVQTCPSEDIVDTLTDVATEVAVCPPVEATDSPTTDLTVPTVALTLEEPAPVAEADASLDTLEDAVQSTVIGLEATNLSEAGVGVEVVAPSLEAEHTASTLAPLEVDATAMTSEGAEILIGSKTEEEIETTPIAEVEVDAIPDSEINCPTDELSLNLQLESEVAAISDDAPSAGAAASVEPAEDRLEMRSSSFKTSFDSQFESLFSDGLAYVKSRDVAPKTE